MTHRPLLWDIRHLLLCIHALHRDQDSKQSSVKISTLQLHMHWFYIMSHLPPQNIPTRYLSTWYWYTVQHTSITISSIVLTSTFLHDESPSMCIAVVQLCLLSNFGTLCSSSYLSNQSYHHYLYILCLRQWNENTCNVCVLSVLEYSSSNFNFKQIETFWTIKENCR